MLLKQYIKTQDGIMLNLEHTPTNTLVKQIPEWKIFLLRRTNGRQQHWNAVQGKINKNEQYMPI